MSNLLYPNGVKFILTVYYMYRKTAHEGGGEGSYQWPIPNNDQPVARAHFTAEISSPCVFKTKADARTTVAGSYFL